MVRVAAEKGFGNGEGQTSVAWIDLHVRLYCKAEWNEAIDTQSCQRSILLVLGTSKHSGRVCVLQQSGNKSSWHADILEYLDGLIPSHNLPYLWLASDEHFQYVPTHHCGSSRVAILVLFFVHKSYWSGTRP